jgi:hypothetical protein
LETFNALGGIYSLMGRYAPENVWGIYFVLAGLTLFIGAWLKNRYFVFAGALMVMVGRLFIMTLVGIYTKWASQGVPDHAIWAIMALVCIWGALRSEP